MMGQDKSKNTLRSYLNTDENKHNVWTTKYKRFPSRTMSKPQIPKIASLPASMSDWYYFPSYSLSSIYFSPLIDISWWSWDLAYLVSICILECMLSPFSHVWLCVTLWTVAHQAPLSMEFSSQEYWSGLSCPPPGNLPNPGIKPTSLMPPTLAGGLPLAPPGKPTNILTIYWDT